MINKKGIVYGIVFFVMFPLCFQITKVLERCLDYMNEVLVSYTLIQLWFVFVGLLSGAYIIVMFYLHKKLSGACIAGKWISLCIVLFNIFVTMWSWFINSSNVLFNMFFYFFCSDYFILIAMLLLFVVVDICRCRKGKEN